LSERTALLVDFGGVLTTSVHDAFRAFSQEISGDPDLILRLLADDQQSSWLLSENECGRIDDETFETGFVARLAAHGVNVSPHGFLPRLQAGFSLDHEMLEDIARLRAGGIPLALVTNQFGRDCYRDLDLESIADVAVISAKIGVRKPSRRIYGIACERLGVDPAACVMVDDIRHNLDGAARLGIAGVLHTSAAATMRELDERFGIRPAAA
jgi:putative hydrolase of the HAD superfamily